LAQNVLQISNVNLQKFSSQPKFSLKQFQNCLFFVYLEIMFEGKLFEFVYLLRFIKMFEGKGGGTERGVENVPFHIFYVLTIINQKQIL
jgi:hypothetical protein